MGLEDFWSGFIIQLHFLILRPDPSLLLVKHDMETSEVLHLHSKLIKHTL